MVGTRRGNTCNMGMGDMSKHSMRKLVSNLQSVDAAEKRKAEDEGTEDNKKVIKDKEEAEKNPRRHIQMKT